MGVFARDVTRDLDDNFSEMGQQTQPSSAAGYGMFFLFHIELREQCLCGRCVYRRAGNERTALERL